MLKTEYKENKLGIIHESPQIRKKTKYENKYLIDMYFRLSASFETRKGCL